MRVFVLLFNARTENEGIHTLRLGDRDVVLMFESEDDATRFALLLEAQDFDSPAVEAFDAEEIEDFCQGAGYEGKFVPEGTLMIPPEASVETTDWQRDAQKSTEVTETSELPSSELDRIRQRLEGLL